MNIELDSVTLSQAIQTAVTAAVAEGVSAWDLRKAIAEQAKTAVEQADLPARVGAILQERLAQEVDCLVAEAVSAALPAIRLAVAESARHMAAGMLYGLKEGPPPSYDDNARRRWRECLALISPEVKEGE